MITINECIDILNKLLADGKTEEDEKLFISVINDCKHNLHLTLKILDFAFYNEKILIEANEKKIKAVSDKNFEFAANCRDAEKKCIELIEMKKNLNIVKSEFKYEDDSLVLYYLGETDQQKKFIKLLTLHGIFFCK